MKKAPRGKPFTKGDDARRANSGLPERFWALREKAQSYGDECIEAAAALLREEAWQARVAGITILLERGFGKPASAPEDLKALQSAGETRPLRELAEEMLTTLASRPLK